MFHDGELIDWSNTDLDQRIFTTPKFIMTANNGQENICNEN